MIDEKVSLVLETTRARYSGRMQDRNQAKVNDAGQWTSRWNPEWMHLMMELLGGRCRYLILHGCVHSCGLEELLVYGMIFVAGSPTSVVRRT